MSAESILSKYHGISKYLSISICIYTYICINVHIHIYIYIDNTYTSLRGGCSPKVSLVVYVQDMFRIVLGFACGWFGFSLRVCLGFIQGLCI